MFCSARADSSSNTLEFGAQIEMLLVEFQIRIALGGDRSVFKLRTYPFEVISYMRPSSLLRLWKIAAIAAVDNTSRSDQTFAHFQFIGT